MWNQACSQSLDGMTSQRAGTFKRNTLQILPCTVSQLLAASQVSSYDFTICDLELDQVSIVSILRGLASFVTNIKYSVDDMTGPPLTVKEWVNIEDCARMTSAFPGTYVRVTGSLRSFNGKRSLLAKNIRCIEDLNEITSHMLEVVQAHMQLFGKAFDVNMNTTAASLPGGVLGHSGGGHPKGLPPNDLSSIQGEVLQILRRSSECDIGISLHELQTQLDYLSQRDIRTSLTFLINEGHAFCTIDEHHFRSAEH